MNEKHVAKFGCLLLAALAFFVSDAFAADWRKFKAVGFEYNVNASPPIRSWKMTSKVSIFSESSVKIVQIKNYLKPKMKHDSLIKIAITSNSIGSAVYNGNNEVIAEYGNGVPSGENHYTFEGKTGENSLEGHWFIEDDSIISDFSVRNPKGDIIFKETIIYSANRPKKK